MYRLVLFRRAPSVQNIRITLGGHHSSGITKDVIPFQMSVGKYVTRRLCTQLFQQTVSGHNSCKEVHSPAATWQSIGHQSCLSLPKRRQSTTTTTTKSETEVKSIQKLKKPRNYKYVDLLEVTNVMASEKRSRVKRLHAKKLQEFIFKTQLQILDKRAKLAQEKGDKTSVTQDAVKSSTVNSVMKQQPVEYQKIDMDVFNNTLLETDTDVFDDKPFIFLGKQQYTKRILSNPQKIENILTSFSKYREIIEAVGEEAKMETQYNANAEKLPEQEEVLDTLDMAELSHVNFGNDSNVSKHKGFNANKVLKEKSKPRYKSKLHNNQEQERLAKERALRVTLHTYLNVCVSNGMLGRAFSTVLSYRRRSKVYSKNQSSLITIEMYNILLHGFAEKGSFERFEDIFALMLEDGVPFNEQTFAAIFECLGRVESNEENKQLILKYINQAEKLGFTLNQIIDRSKFVFDQREIALDAIRRIQPDFIPVYTPPKLVYANELLNHLNSEMAATDSSVADQTKGKIMLSKGNFTQQELEAKAREQLKIELDGCITIPSIEKSKEFPNANYCREKLAETEQRWRSQIIFAINRDLNTLRAQIRFKPQGQMNYYTYLKSLDAGTYADILIKESYKLAEGSETYSPSVMQLYKELGQKVQQKVKIKQKKENGILEKIGDIYSAYSEKWQCTEQSDNTRQMWQRLVHEQRSMGPSMDIDEAVWPNNVSIGVGRFLYNILMRDIKIDIQIMRQKSKSKKQNLLPAFYTLFRNHSRTVTEEVKPHPVLARLLRASKQQTLTFDSNLVPMLCPPQPWSTPYNGGYLLNKSELIRLPHQAIQQWERIKSSNAECLYPSLDSLNQLASIPWRVNTDILDVIIEVFQKGGDHKLDVPQAPTSLPSLPTLSEADTSITSAERAKLFKEKMVHRRKQAEMYSLWCDTLYRLSLANHYREKVFWLPHNMDFRGRVYPIPPHLNHLGSDLARSILVFDQAQPLGVDGFGWLKLHCINLTGLKKRESVRERLLFAEAIMDEILDSADNPLTGRMWWAKSDEPWQTLACCMEIAKVKRSANPEEYLSHFPIHQDGSCNGLQHYAALGRDKAGAISVNLAPSEKPQDVYSAVAAMVENIRIADAENGLHVAQALQGFVRRKVIKQTVMTTVYGVTRYGARLQIARQLKDIDDFPKDWVWPASTYLTTKTFESLREMFTSTREIQDWFTECARLISGACGQNVEWVTPLGLPVVQPYNRQEVKRPSIVTRNVARVNENMPMDMYERPNIMKQKNAFPPNFIHSLDSSHMMLTSLHCERAGLTFVSVHDCFWTHACNVPDLNKICREQFVSLHSQPILEDLSKFMLQTYSSKTSELDQDGSAVNNTQRNLNSVLSQLPKKGDFDLRNVLDSVYFFS